MQNVLADLCVESEAATVTGDAPRPRLRPAPGTSGRRSFKRLATAVSKYWICKRAAVHAHEALECFGGNGYVEESGMPRLYRESPLNSIWEGSGNVICLDVLRAHGARARESSRSSSTEIEEAAAAEPRLRTVRRRPEGRAVRTSTTPRRARAASSSGWRSRSRASLLVRYGDPAVADAFCASRLAGDWGRAFGTLPAGIDSARDHRAPPAAALSSSAPRTGPEQRAAPYHQSRC